MAASGLDRRSTVQRDALIERLADWGVDTVFGLPGDGINGIMEALLFRDKIQQLRS